MFVLNVIMLINRMRDAKPIDKTDICTIGLNQFENCLAKFVIVQNITVGYWSAIVVGVIGVNSSLNYLLKTIQIVTKTA